MTFNFFSRNARIYLRFYLGKRHDNYENCYKVGKSDNFKRKKASIYSKCVINIIAYNGLFRNSKTELQNHN